MAGREVTQDDVRAVLASDELLTDAPVVATGFKTNLVSWYDLVKRGEAPVMPIMVGRRQKYRVADLRRVLLGVEDAGGAA